mgnify:CR=1 FL=1
MCHTLRIAALCLTAALSPAAANAQDSAVPPVAAEVADPPAPHTHDTDPRDRFITNRPSAIELPLTDEQDAFFFVVFGDRTGGPAEGVRVLAQAVEDTNLLKPDLVMTVGDMINGYSPAEPWLAQMREFKGIMDDLDCPWYPVAGNHDIYLMVFYHPNEGHQHLKSQNSHMIDKVENEFLHKNDIKDLYYATIDSTNAAYSNLLAQLEIDVEDLINSPTIFIMEHGNGFVMSGPRALSEMKMNLNELLDNRDKGY